MAGEVRADGAATHAVSTGTVSRWRVLDKKADKVEKVCIYCGKKLKSPTTTTCAEHADLHHLDPTLLARKNGRRGKH